MTISNIQGRTVGIAFAALVLLTLMLTPATSKAADLDGGDYGWVDTATYDTWEPTYSSYDDYGWVDTAYYDTWEPSYESGYDSGCYSCGGSFGGGSFGGGFVSSGRSTVSYIPPTSSFSSSYTNVHEETCSAPNSCNSYYDDHSVVSFDDHSIFNAPTVVTINDSYDYDDRDEKKSKKNKSRDYDDDRKVVYHPPVYHNPTPYVTLSQVPYTGLELTPMQMVLYWGFIVAWCLLAAYLIAVKKMHVGLATRIKTFLFGDDGVVTHPVYAAAVAAHAPQVATSSAKFSQNDIAELATALLEVLEGKTTRSYEAPVAASKQEDTTDSFILSQINRNG